MSKKTMLVTFLMMSIFVISGTASAVVELNLATTYSSGNMHAEKCREFAKRVNETLSGEVLITVHEGGALGLKDEDRFTAVADNIAPIQSVLMGSTVGTSPIYGLSTLPFLVKNFDEAKLLLDIARPYYEQEAKKFNQRILFTAPWPPSSIHAKRPIHKLKDIKGLRIRTYDKNGTEVLKNTGANAMVMSWGDVYPALATNTIDSVLTSSQSAVAGKFWEVLTDTTRIYFAIPLNMLNINLDEFNKLTPKQREVLISIGNEMETRQWKIAEEAMTRDEAKCAAKGMKITTEIPDELARKLSEAGQGVIESWLKKTGKIGKEILEKFEAERKKL